MSLLTSLGAEGEGTVWIGHWQHKWCIMNLFPTECAGSAMKGWQRVPHYNRPNPHKPQNPFVVRQVKRFQERPVRAGRRLLLRVGKLGAAQVREKKKIICARLCTDSQKGGKVMKRRKGSPKRERSPRLTHTRADTRPLRFDLDADARIVAFVAGSKVNWRRGPKSPP